MLFAWAGAIVFAASLVFFYARYFLAPDLAITDASGTGRWIPEAWDVVAFTVFALHHSVFARTGAKAWVTRVVPTTLERSVYVWIASVLFVGVLLTWRAVPGTAWTVTGAAGLACRGVQAFGLWITITAARRLDTLELAGVRQVTSPEHASSSTLIADGLYGLVRHPIYLGWILMVWPAPVMTGARLVFAATTTLYLLIAIPFEERGLRRTLGPAYDTYRARVTRRIVPFIY
jgi:protein-S-isoprenylcysteine O-methyltransferase Ste14